MNELHAPTMGHMTFNKRQPSMLAPPLLMVLLDPALVVEGKRLREGYLTEDFRTFGSMRETCPECEDLHLQLVLKQTNVRHAHLFCPGCTRCFDVCYPDGSSALSPVLSGGDD